jgi:hypothetical protein
MTSVDRVKSSASVIKFLVGDRALGKWSYAWRVGSGGTSFYVKPLAGWAQDIKISLHGPDTARGLTGGYKIEVDSTSADVVKKAGEVARKLTNWPDKQWFSGARVNDDVDLVIRLRFAWDLFTPDATTAPAPKSLRSREFGHLIAVPERDRAVDVELMVCKSAPWWPNEAQARRDNACLGPVMNKAGQFLTGVVVHREIAAEPSPLVQYEPAGQVGGPQLSDRVRGVGAALDARGFLWIHECWLSQAELTAQRFAAFKPPS